MERNSRHARGKGLPPWQYAVLISTLEAAGLSESDLRWLVEHDYVEHAVDCTRSVDEHHRFRMPARAVFDRKTSFILTEAGAALARRRLEDLAGKRASAAGAPRWDAVRRELRVHGTIVRHFFKAAPYQELILSRFEESGWPEHIADPPPEDLYQNPKQRLHDTIKRLNHGLQPLLVHFSGDGTGTGVQWEFRLARLPGEGPGSEFQKASRSPRQALSAAERGR